MEKVLFTLLGVICGGLLNHLTATLRYEKQLFDTAALKFNAVLFEDMKNNNLRFKNFKEIEERFNKIYWAAVEFSSSLKGNKKKRSFYESIFNFRDYYNVLKAFEEKDGFGRSLSDWEYRNDKIIDLETFPIPDEVLMNLDEFKFGPEAFVIYTEKKSFDECLKDKWNLICDFVKKILKMNI